MSNYALLAGAIGGFLALTVLMFTTLKMDWSGRLEPLRMQWPS